MALPDAAQRKRSFYVAFGGLIMNVSEFLRDISYEDKYNATVICSERGGEFWPETILLSYPAAPSK